VDRIGIDSVMEKLIRIMHEKYLVTPTIAGHLVNPCARILIAEAFTYHSIDEDIGRVKNPAG